MLNTNEKEVIKKEILDRVAVYHKLFKTIGGDVPDNVACIFYANATFEIMTERGERAVIVGGSRLWPPQTESFESDGAFAGIINNKVAASLLAQGHLPQNFHAWVLSDGKVIDGTTRHIIEHYQEKTGRNWEGSPPPEFLWDKSTHYENREPETTIALSWAKIISVTVELLENKKS